tara:strand:+ start:2014 stop:2790 length:777 start_codon:yes stop_codon:yes gene_type:complete
MERKKQTKEERALMEKERQASRREQVISEWIPKTELGKKVKAGEITDIDQVLDAGMKILEPQIVDILIPSLEYDLVTVGQSKGKFGGGKRSIWKQTQKKTSEGNKPKFSTIAIIGNKDGYVGLGRGKAKETVPAREKAIRNAKLGIIKLRRGCGSWEGVPGSNSIPFEVEGRCGSVRLRLIPAPSGTGLVAHKEIQKILKFAGIKDVYSKTKGQTKTQINLVKACMEAFKKLNSMKVKEEMTGVVGLIEGKSDKNSNN